MSFEPLREDALRRTCWRCVCDFSEFETALSPDVKTLILGASVLERQLSRVTGRLLPRGKTMSRTVAEDYQVAADAIAPHQGLILPCEIEAEGDTGLGVVVLGEKQAGSRFACEVLFDRRISLRPGDKLLRRLDYAEPLRTEQIEFESQVAKITSVLR
jgi:hypothetical protein